LSHKVFGVNKCSAGKYELKSIQDECCVAEGEIRIEVGGGLAALSN